MKITFTAASLLFLCSLCAEGQSIDSVSGPRVWLRADQSILDSTKWTDVSFYKNDARAASSRERPSPTGTINYNKAVVFDGLDDYFKIPYSLEGLADLSVLAVFQSSDTTERGVWGSEQGSSRNILLTTRQAVGPDTLSDVYGKAENITTLHSVLQNWDKTTTVSSTAFFALGSAGRTKGFKPFKGSLAELIVFNHALTFLERVQFETYLAIKYGTGLRGGNFVSSGEKALWKVEENKEYGRNIAGIGRDDFFKLNQKQSGSAYDSGFLVMSAGLLAKSNSENKATLADQDFVLWGDNGLPLSAKPGVGVDSVLSQVQRKWLATVTGNTAGHFPVELHVDAAQLPVSSLGYWLVIDRSGQANFSVDNLEYVFPDRITTDGKVIFKDILWDKDNSGKDRFGLAKARNLLAVVRKLRNPSCTNVTAGRVRIEMISGKAPYQCQLSSAANKISRTWKTSAKAIEQEELAIGDYILTVTDAGGDVIKRAFTLIMPDALHIDLGPDLKITPGKQIALDVSPQVPDSVSVTYHWENNFGFSSDQTKISISESGIYRVSVTKVRDGCVFSDEVVVSGSDSLRIAVYPTVASNGFFNASVSLPDAGSVIVKIYNASGMLTQEMQGQNSSEYHFTGYVREPGLYLVLLQTSKGIAARKVIAY
jgi:hypothetical protein